MKTACLLIDFENVQPKTLELLNGQPFKVFVFHGVNQTRVPLGLAKALQPLGNSVSYIQVSGSGRNALDFHIAFKLGQLVTERRGDCYYILSKDAGFDPLIKHLQAEGIQAQRIKDVADVPLPGRSGGGAARDKTTSSPEKLGTVVANLQKRSGRPRKVSTLKSTINALFSKSLKESELNDILAALAAKKYIIVEGDNVSYRLADGSGR